MRFLKLVITAVTLTTVWGLPQMLNDAGGQGERSISARLKRDSSSALSDPSSQHLEARRRTTVKRRIERRTENGPEHPGQNPANPPHDAPHPPLDDRTRAYLQEMTEILLHNIPNLSPPVARCMAVKVRNLKLQGVEGFDTEVLHNFRVECEEEFARRLAEAGFTGEEDFIFGGEDAAPRQNGSPRIENRPEEEDGRNGYGDPPLEIKLEGFNPKAAIRGTLNTIGGRVNDFAGRVKANLRPQSSSGAQRIKPAGFPAGFPAGGVPARPLL